MIVNISSVKSFQRCRLRWLFEWYLGRVPSGGSEALEFGKLLHRAFEYHFEGRDFNTAIDLAITELTLANARVLADEPLSTKALVLAKSIATLNQYREVLSLWTDKFPITETLEVEEPFELRHPNGKLIVKGRPDRVAVVYGKTFHIQNRSLSGSRNIGLYLELAKQDMHELVYGWAIAQKYPQYEFGGTIFNILRKLTYRGAKGQLLHSLDELLVQAAIPVLPQAQMQTLMDIAWIADEMQRTIDEYNEGIVPARNRELDGGYFGSSIDPYWPVITGTATLDDDTLYTNREDPYANAL